MVLARLLAAFAGPAPPPVPEPLIDVLKYHLRSMPLAGAVVYLAVILALHRLMRWREQPLSIPRSALVMYNLVQVAINAYVAYAIAHAVGGWVFGLGVRDTPAVRHGVYLHYLCKVRTRTPPRPTAPAVSLSRQPLASHTSPSRLPPVLTLGSAAPPYSCQLSRHPAPTCSPIPSPEAYLHRLTPPVPRHAGHGDHRAAQEVRTATQTTANKQHGHRKGTACRSGACLCMHSCMH